MEKRKKKGATLLEIIISMAIIAILVIPISNLIMTSVMNNKRAKEKQNVKLLGQRISESIKDADIELGASSVVINKGIDEGKDNKTIEADNYKDIKLEKDPINADKYEVSSIDIGKGLKADITLEKRKDMPSDNVLTKINWDAIINLDYNDVDKAIYVKVIDINKSVSSFEPQYRLSENKIFIDNLEDVVYVGFKYLNPSDGTEVYKTTKLSDGNKVNDVINFKREKINKFYDGKKNLLTTATGYIKFIIDEEIPDDTINSLSIKVNNRCENAPITINAETENRDLPKKFIENTSEAYEELTINRYYSRRELDRDERIGTAYNYVVKIYDSKGYTVYKDFGLKNLK